MTRKTARFNLLLFSPIQNPDPNRAIASLLDSMKRITTAQPVEYSEFKAHTQSKAISRFIVVPSDDVLSYSHEVAEELADRDKLRSISEFASNKAKGDADLNSNSKPLPLGFSMTNDDIRYADPRYGVMDIHEMHNIRKMVGKISIHPNIPIVLYQLYDHIALKLSKRGYRVDSLAVEEVNGKTYEHIASFMGGEVKNTRTVPENPVRKLFTSYRNNTGIDIREIMMDMDENIDILMAPLDLEDTQRALKAYRASLKFMEDQGLTNEDDYQYTKDDIQHMEELVQRLERKVLTEPKVKPFYFKFEDPRVLSSFKIPPQNKE